MKAATGEVVSAEDLGGADLHCKTSGVTDHYAMNDMDATIKARLIIASLHHKKPNVRPIALRIVPRRCQRMSTNVVAHRA